MPAHDYCPFYTKGCLYVSRFGWSTGFFSIIEASIFTELAHSFAHNYFSFLIMFLFLQGGRAFALKIARLKDPELPKLPADLPLCTIEAKAPSMTEHYSRAFQKFREWSSPYTEVVCLPSDELSVSLYLFIHLATNCITTYTTFLHYNELASLRCCDISFAILLSRFMFIKVKWMFIDMVPTSSWQKQGTFLALSICFADTFLLLI